MRNARLISIGLFFLVMAFGRTGFAAGRPVAHSQQSHRGRRMSKSAPAHRAQNSPKSDATRQQHEDPFPAHLRDPFAPLLAENSKQGGKVVARPPGKAGLSIDEIVVQGTVTGPHGAVALVTSPDGHVYFLRVGDRLFDGAVEKIELHQVVFVQHARDAFGRKFDRLVTKAVQPPEGAKP